MAESEFVYVTYIRTTPEKLWQALTDPDLRASSGWARCRSADWKVGSTWKMKAPDGRVADAGEVLEIAYPRRLVLSWQNHLFPEMTAEGFSRMSYDLEPKGRHRQADHHAHDGQERFEDHQGSFERMAALAGESQEPAGDGGIAGRIGSVAGRDLESEADGRRTQA